MKEYILCLINNDNGREVYLLGDEKFTLKKELAKKFMETELEELKAIVKNINSTINENIELKILFLNELNNVQ